jgi:hypothetical protein
MRIFLTAWALATFDPMPSNRAPTIRDFQTLFILLYLPPFKLWWLFCSGLSVASVIDRGINNSFSSRSWVKGFPDKEAGDDRMSGEPDPSSIAAVEAPNGSRQQ